MADSRKKLSFINYAYAIGAIFVVLGHSTPTSASDMPQVVEHIRTFIYCFHMPLFFFIAGVLLRYTKSENRPPYLRFIGNKAIKFLVPYFVFTFLGLIPKVLLANFTNDEVSFSFQYIFKTIFSPRDNVWGHFWFLPTLLLIYMVSYLILDASRNKAISAVLVIATACLAVFPIATDWVCLHDISEMLVFFVLGVVLGGVVTGDYEKVFKPVAAILSTVVAIAIFVLFIIFLYDNAGYSGIVYQFLKFIIGCLMVYTVLTISVALADRKVKVFTLLFGKTFSIYILSWPCQAFAEIVFNRVLHMSWPFVMLAMFAFGLSIPLFIVWLYKKLSGKSKIMNCLLGIY